MVRRPLPTHHGIELPPVRFDAKMPASMKRPFGARLVTLVAACLASAAAFGLHPEPDAGPAAASLAPAIELVASGGANHGRHDCLACRAHRPLLSAPTPADVTGQQTSAIRPVAPNPLEIRVFSLLRLDGRSPPLAS